MHPARETLRATTLWRNEALSVSDIRCDSTVTGLHAENSISYIRKGSLSYCARGQTFELVAGAVLIGRADVDYRCSHEGAGAECLAFRFAPALVDALGDASS